MEAKELQIGDWVLYTEFGRNKKCKVEIIEPNRVWLNGCRTYVPIEFIEPIPITPEILEKNGFIRGKNSSISYYYYYDKTSIGVTFYERCILVEIEAYCKTTNGVNRLHNCDIKYIHQLQQAMRLCGIDKEIKL